MHYLLANRPLTLLTVRVSTSHFVLRFQKEVLGIALESIPHHHPRPNRLAGPPSRLGNRCFTPGRCPPRSE